MRIGRFMLLVVSLVVVVLLVGGGLAMKVGADEGSYRQSVLFAEVLSLVMDNYVDPVEGERLLRGAYEGMLAGIDPNGAFLAPDEVEQWKAGPPSGQADPGIIVLKNGRTLHVVAVASGSPAADAGIEVGDQIRQIDGQDVRDLSLEQSRRLLLGPPGRSVELSVLRPRDRFKRQDLSVGRTMRRPAAYRLDVERGFGVLTIVRLADLPVAELAAELDDVRTRGVDTVLIDLRNVADASPREAMPLIGLFSDDGGLELRDPSGRLVESLAASEQRRAWAGRVALLVNGATAGGGEAVATALSDSLDATVYGESTYGLGAETRLYELESGAGLLISSALWETSTGGNWNRDGLEPDEAVDGDGTTFDEVIADQRRKVLERLEAADADEADSAADGAREAA